MTSTLEHQADQITRLSRRIEQLESSLKYTSGVIASMAADGDTTSTVFTVSVGNYKALREEHWGVMI